MDRFIYYFAADKIQIKFDCDYFNKIFPAGQSLEVDSVKKKFSGGWQPKWYKSKNELDSKPEKEWLHMALYVEDFFYLKNKKMVDL